MYITEFSKICAVSTTKPTNTHYHMHIYMYIYTHTHIYIYIILYNIFNIGKNRRRKNSINSYLKYGLSKLRSWKKLIGNSFFSFFLSNDIYIKKKYYFTLKMHQRITHYT